MRDRLNVSLPVAMISQIGDLATRRKVTRSAVVEAAVASLLSPDNGSGLHTAAGPADAPDAAPGA